MFWSEIISLTVYIPRTLETWIHTVRELLIQVKVKLALFYKLITAVGVGGWASSALLRFEGFLRIARVSENVRTDVIASAVKLIESDFFYGISKRLITYPSALEVRVSTRRGERIYQV